MLFEYTASSISEVLAELQRQYNVVIQYPENMDYYYTGDVDLNRDFETSLNLVCRPFEITFEKISEGVYKLNKNPDKNN